MRTMIKKSRRVLLASFALPIVLFGGCGNDPTEPDDPAEAVRAMRLTIGTTTITVNEAGTVTGGAVTIGTGSTTVTAVFLDEDGAVVSGLDEFQLQGVSSNTGVVTFQLIGGFSGRLTRVTAGTTQVRFALFHPVEQHEDFGPWPVTITVQ